MSFSIIGLCIVTVCFGVIISVSSYNLHKLTQAKKAIEQRTETLLRQERDQEKELASINILIASKE